MNNRSASWKNKSVKLIAPVLIGMVFFFTTACSKLPGSLQHVRGMYNLFIAGDTTTAIECFTLSIKRNPGSWESYFGRGNALLLSGKIEAAVDDYNHALVLAPDETGVRLARAGAYGMMKKNTEAITDLDKVIAVDPDNFKALQMRAVAFSDIGKSEQAEQDAARAIKLAPQDAGAYLTSGYVYHKEKKYPQALESYSKSLKLNPESDMLLVNLSDLYVKTGEFDKAIDEATKVIQRGDDIASAYNNRGYAYIGKKNYTAAYYDMKRALEGDPQNGETNYGMGLVLEAQGERVKAGEFFNKAKTLGFTAENLK